MKANIHPKLVESKVACACGASFTTMSVKPEIHCEVCNECHSAYTGKQGHTKKTGNIEKFNQKFGRTDQNAA